MAAWGAGGRAMMAPMFVLLLAACPGPIDSKTPDLPDPDTGDPDTGEEVTVLEHCGLVQADEVWKASRPHRVTCDVTIERGTLTIEPGTAVTFDERAGLAVGTGDYEASLAIDGTTDGVVFSRSGDQDWDGVVIGANAEAVSISGLSVRGTANGVRIDGAEVTIGSLAIDGASEGCGFTLEEGARLADGATGLTVTGAATWSVCAEVASADSLPAAASSYTGNTTDGVYLVGDEISRAVTWEDLGVPYVIAEVVDVAGTAGEPAVFTIGAGVEVLLDRDRGFRFSRSGDASAFYVEGTAEAPVRFASLGADTAGFWRGLSASVGTGDFSLRNVQLSGGGGDGGTLQSEDVDVYLEQVSIERSAGAAVRLEGEAAFVAGSVGLVVRESEVPVTLAASAVPSLPSSGLAFSDNEIDAIQVAGGSKVGDSGTWSDLGLPYWVVDDVEIDGTAEAPAVVTFAPGVALLFDNDAKILVGKTGAAGLRVEGTSSLPVTMLPWSANTPGAWGGIGVYDAAVDADVLIEHAEIGYGGGASLRGNIHAVDSAPTLRQVHLHSSLEWGLYLSDAVPVVDGVTYADNTSGDCNECP